MFLAIPALQRNSRNTQRSNDAAKVSAAINECLTNHNGLPASCSIVGANPDFYGAYDKSKSQQIDTVNDLNAYPGNGNVVNYKYGFKCDSTGSGTPVAGSSRQYVVLWTNENTSGFNINRCVDS